MSNVSINFVRFPNPNTQSIKLKETINLLALKKYWKWSAADRMELHFMCVASASFDKWDVFLLKYNTVRIQIKEHYKSIYRKYKKAFKMHAKYRRSLKTFVLILLQCSCCQWREALYKVNKRKLSNKIRHNYRLLWGTFYFYFRPIA